MIKAEAKAGTETKVSIKAMRKLRVIDQRH